MFNLNTTITFLFATLTAVTPPAAAATTGNCDPADVLLANDRHRRTAGVIGETRCYRVEIPARGLLHLVATSTTFGPSATTVVIDIAAAPRPSRAKLSATPTAGLPVLARSANEILALVDPGHYWIRVRAEDPERSLPVHRLTSRFLEGSKSETDDELDLEPEEILAAPPATVTCRPQSKERDRR